MTKKVAIIGGGLAGISATRHAMNAGLHAEIFEASDRCGGRVSSDNIDGYVIDRGFQVINLNYPELKRLLNTKPASQPIFDVINYPSRKRRTSISPFKPLSIISALFSNDVNSRILEPFLRGVFLMDPKEVDVKIKSRITRYFLKGRPHLIDGGVGHAISALIDSIPTSHIHLNCTVTEIIPGSSTDTVKVKYQGGESGDFDYVIVATNSMPGAIAGTSGGNSRKWNPSSTVYHSVDAAKVKECQLYIGSTFANSSPISMANSTLAPAGNTLIATTYLEELTPQIWQEKKTAYEREIAALYGVRVDELTLISIQSIPHSLPRFSRSDTPEINRLMVDPKKPKIIYAGDSFEEPSQNGALRSGRKAIEVINKL